MPSVREVIVSVFTGVLFAGGWWAFINGAIHSEDAFPTLHLLPALGSTMAAIFINFASINQITMQSVKIWIFIWVTIACVSIGVAIWITSTEYPPDANWGGASIIVQTLLVFTAGILFFTGKKNIGGGGEYGDL